VDVAEEEILQALIEKEFQPQGTAVGEGQEEGGETAAGPADGDFAEMSPIGLSLLTGEGTEAQKSFPVGGTQFRHDATKLGHTPGVAARANHLEEAGGAQARILLQGLAEEVEVRISEAIAEAGMATEAVGVEGATDGVGMEAEFSRNGAHLPMLGVKEMTDVSDLFIGNHAAPREKD
jgi:hypothetical protein